MLINSVSKVAIVITGCFMLSACPEPGSNIRTYCMNSNEEGRTLRIYTPGNRIEYIVSGIHGNVSTVDGSLTVEWLRNRFITNPLNGTDTYAVIEQRTELQTPSLNSSSLRFLVQENETNGIANGTTHVWAYQELPPSLVQYWFNTNPDTNSRNTVEKATLLKSPLTGYDPATGNLTSIPENSSYEFYPMLGCSTISGECTEKFAKIKEDMEIKRVEIVETLQGTFFQAYRIDFGPFNVQSLGSSQQLPVNFDFRHACGTSGLTTISGTKWLHPKVGFVKFVVACSNDASANNFYNYVFDFRTANFTLPNSQPDENSCT